MSRRRPQITGDKRITSPDNGQGVMQRRDLLKAAVALAAAGVPGPRLWAGALDADLEALGKPQAFDYAWLKGQRAHSRMPGTARRRTTSHAT